MKNIQNTKQFFTYLSLIVLILVMLLVGYNWDVIQTYISGFIAKNKKGIMEVSKLPFIGKVKENQKEFGLKVIEIAKKLNTKAEYLMIIMNNESGLNHRAKNPNGSATGLIQFIESTAKGMGTTTAKIKAMSNVEQLDLVYKYLVKYADKFVTVSDVYLAVFFPLALYKDESYVFPDWVIKANPNFDLNKDKIGTKKEFREYVNKKYAKYLV